MLFAFKRFLSLFYLLRNFKWLPDDDLCFALALIGEAGTLSCLYRVSFNLSIVSACVWGIDFQKHLFLFGFIFEKVCLLKDYLLYN